MVKFVEPKEKKQLDPKKTVQLELTVEEISFLVAVLGKTSSEEAFEKIEKSTTLFRDGLREVREKLLSEKIDASNYNLKNYCSWDDILDSLIKKL